jgi:hypothetical protein
MRNTDYTLPAEIALINEPCISHITIANNFLLCGLYLLYLVISGFYLVITGYISLYLVIFGYIWLNLVLSGYFWLYLVISGYMWFISGFIWLYLVSQTLCHAVYNLWTSGANFYCTKAWTWCAKNVAFNASSASWLTWIYGHELQGEQNVHNCIWLNTANKAINTDKCESPFNFVCAVSMVLSYLITLAYRTRP